MPSRSVPVPPPRRARKPLRVAFLRNRPHLVETLTLAVAPAATCLRFPKPLAQLGLGAQHEYGVVEATVVTDRLDLCDLERSVIQRWNTWQRGAPIIGTRLLTDRLRQLVTTMALAGATFELHVSFVPTMHYEVSFKLGPMGLYVRQARWAGALDDLENMLAMPIPPPFSPAMRRRLGHANYLEAADTVRQALVRSGWTRP